MGACIVNLSKSKAKDDKTKTQWPLSLPKPKPKLLPPVLKDSSFDKFPKKTIQWEDGYEEQANVCAVTDDIELTGCLSLFPSISVPVETTLMPDLQVQEEDYESEDEEENEFMQMANMMKRAQRACRTKQSKA